MQYIEIKSIFCCFNNNNPFVLYKVSVYTKNIAEPYQFLAKEKNMSLVSNARGLITDRHIQLINGIFFVGLFAGAAYQFSQWHYIAMLGISPLIVGIVMGMLYGNTLRLHLPVYWILGIVFSSKGLLRIAIVLYGFRLTYQDVFVVGVEGLLIAAVMLTSTFVGGSWLGIKAFGLPKELAILTAAGSSVCGAAAVLATEPVVNAKSHESSVAVGTVVLFGTLAMFIYPSLYGSGLLGMSPEQYGMFAGGTLHEVAHAVAAGQAVSPEAANTSIIVKMMRVMMIAPLLICLGWWLSRGSQEEGKGVSSYDMRSFPWFAVLFLVCIGVNSLGFIPQDVVQDINDLDTFMLTMAMCALGMETSFSKVRAVGPKPFILAGLLSLWLLFGGYALSAWIFSMNF